MKAYEMNRESNLNINQAVEFLSSLRGEYVWFVRSDEYGILRLDFGNPHLSIREPNPIANSSKNVADALQRRLVIPTGKWHLFVESGLWSIEAGGFHGARTDQQIDPKVFGQLEGQKLTSVEYLPDACEWIFKFDLSGTLSIKAPVSEDGGDSQWVLFFENGGCLSCEGANRISIEE
jgi:hypothetical protein